MIITLRKSHKPHRGSVLPHIAVTRTREGARLSAGGGGGAELAAFLFFGAVIFFYTFLLQSGELGWNRQITTFAAVIILTLSLGGLWRGYVRGRQLRGATLLVRSWPLCLGSTVNVDFHAHLRSMPEAITAKLVCVEETKYAGGKFETRKAATRYEIDLDTSRKGWEFQVPAEALPSLAVQSNKVRWLLRVVVTTGGHDVPVEFELVVVPEIAS